MKKVLLILFMGLGIMIIKAQTYESAGNGNWTTPTTWTPMGVPVSFDEVTINHAVILDTDFIMNSGALNINGGGSLTESASNRSFVLAGGEINNGGTFVVTNFWNEGGDFYNWGTSDFSKFLNERYVENSGVIENVDSLRNIDEIYNTVDGEIYVWAFSNENYLNNTGLIDGENYLNAGYMINYNRIDFINITNIDTIDNQNGFYFNNFTNIGLFENSDYVEGTNDFTNIGEFNNYEEINLENDFLNVDSANGEAYFYNEGLFVIGHDFMNIDTIEGFGGQFCITNNTGNTGAMIGNFDFCDNTPPTMGPYIDYNIGFIDEDITYCAMPCGMEVEIGCSEGEILAIYPNPARERVIIEIGGKSPRGMLAIYNAEGQIIREMMVEGQAYVGLEDLAVGIYLIRLSLDNNRIISKRLLVE
ncbi:MAG: T9SS type A sorting domain-containing protein [Bacteroidales bacterium]|nr:T9SS type A sorting domain-containing protein [Bacteroidales bacterium]